MLIDLKLGPPPTGTISEAFLALLSGSNLEKPYTMQLFELNLRVLHGIRFLLIGFT